MTTFEMHRREEKVAKLVDALVEGEMSADLVRTFDDADWSMVAKAAKVNSPSPITRQATIARLEAIERAVQKRSA